MGRLTLPFVLKKLWKIPLALVSMQVQPRIILTAVVMGWQLRKEVKTAYAWTELAVKYAVSRGTSRQVAQCKLCDKVVGDLLKATEELEFVPCAHVCFRFENCVEMCNNIKSLQMTASRFPCISAGYCPAEGGEVGGSQFGVPECRVDSHFGCAPSSHCRRVLRGLRWQCELKPGIAKWVAMQRTMRTNAGALAAALQSWPRCTDDGASSLFCVSDPQGSAWAAEVVSMLLIFVWGGYKSVCALKTSGGDDDRQWLTFWLITTWMSTVEGYARVLLSRWIPPYYELKMLFIVWLCFDDGADKLFRRAGHFWNRIKYLLGLHRRGERTKLASLGDCGQLLEFIDASSRTTRFTRYYASSGVEESVIESGSPDFLTGWSRELEDLCILYAFVNEHLDDVRSKFGAEPWWSQIEEESLECRSFDPRFVSVALVRASGLPRLSRIGGDGVDPYAVVSIEPFFGKPYGHVRHSKTKFGSAAPVWNEGLELRLQGGAMDHAGMYQNRTWREASLVISIQDEDGAWLICFLDVAFALGFAFLFGALFFAFVFTPYCWDEFDEQVYLKLFFNENAFVSGFIDVTAELSAFVTKVMRMGDGRVDSAPLLTWVTCLVLIGLLQKSWRSFQEKDGMVGSVRVPLRDLQDRQEHFITDELLYDCLADKEKRGVLTFAVRLLEE